MRIALRDVIKSPDVEDPINLHVHRPLQLALARPLVRTSITPNQVTFLSLSAGLGSAVCIARGALLAGAALLFASAILDGVDGMIARLKKTASDAGHAIDGASDYVVNVATTAAAALFLSRTMGWIAFALAFVAHVAWAHHLMLYDFQSSTFLRVLSRGKHAGGDLAKARALRAAGWKAWLVAAYAWQLGNRQRFVERVLPNAASPEVGDGDAWIERHRAEMRAWAWLGNAPHMDGMVLAAATGRFDVYFAARIGLFTLLAVVLCVRDRRAAEVLA
jgi:phosphatidylglycerophosphate synthase